MWFILFSILIGGVVSYLNKVIFYIGASFFCFLIFFRRKALFLVTCYLIMYLSGYILASYYFFQGKYKLILPQGYYAVILKDCQILIDGDGSVINGILVRARSLNRSLNEKWIEVNQKFRFKLPKYYPPDIIEKPLYGVVKIYPLYLNFNSEFVYRGEVVSELFSTERIEPNFRRTILLRILKGGIKEVGSSILAFLFGERGSFPPCILSLFRKTGVSHILAISGLHIAFFGYLVYSLVTSILRRSTFLVEKGGVIGVGGIVAMVSTWVYIFLSGGALPSLRAGVMFSLYIISKLFKRKYHGLNSLGFVGTLFVFLQPQDILTVQFILSFFSVAVIFIIYPEAEKRLNSVFDSFNPILRTLLKFILFNGVMWLWLLPLVAYLFHYLPTYAILANIIIVPLVTYLILPLSILSLVFILIGYNLNFLLKIVSYILDYIISVLEVINELPYSEVSITPFPIYYLFLVYLGLLSFWFIKKIRLLRLILGIIVVSFVVILPLNYFFNRDRLEVYNLDVGHGSSIILRFPKQDIVWMVDTGGDKIKDKDFIGSQVLLPFLKLNRIDKIDKVFITHYHKDHYGALLSLMDKIKIKEIVLPIRDQEPDDVITKAKEKKIKTLYLSCGKYSENGIIYEVLYPCNYNNTTDLSENNLSYVIRLKYLGWKLLFTGDIEKEGIQLLDKGKLKSDIIFVPHHGAQSSLDKDFIYNIMPRLAIYSLGREEELPKLVYKEYAKVKAVNISTKECGMIRLDIFRRSLHYNSFFCNSGTIER